MIKEQWLPIPGTGDNYEVSDMGNVRSVDRMVKPKSRQPYFRKGRPLSPISNRRGYFGLFLGQSKREYVHRLVLLAFIGEEANRPEVNHKDGNKSNNCLSNLEWVTRQENSQHCKENHLNKSYDKHGCANPRFKHGNRTRVDSPSICPLCGTSFTARYITSKYCSKQCIGRHTMARINAKQP